MEEQPSQDEQNRFFSVGLEMWDRAKKVYDLVDNFHKGEEKKEDEGLKTLKDLAREIKELKEEKETLITKSIGYMYNGVLVSGDISCRKGKVYRFRCQYKLENSQIKKAIMKNLQEVEGKLSEPNMDILETLLEMVDENENRYNNPYNRRFGSNSGEQVEMELPHIRVAEFSRNYGVSFLDIVKVVINESGEISFDDENETSIRLDGYTNYMLKAKLKDELRQLASGFVEKQTAKRDFLQKEVDTIKSKALNLLMLAEIDNQNDK